MKRFFLLLGALCLFGAGCVNGFMTTQAPPSWFVTFENGQTWYPYTLYWKSGVEFGTYAKPSYGFEERRIWLQNVPQPIRAEEVISSYKEGYAYYEGDDWIIADITVYPKPGAKLPKHGLETVQYGDNTFAMRVSGGRNLYYWESDARVYEFFLMTGKGHDVGAEELLSVMQEVENVVAVEEEATP